jgi:hypothetical protein
MSGWKLQLQPAPQRYVLTPWWGVEMAVVNDSIVEETKQFITESHRSFLRASVETLRNISTIFTMSTGAAYLIIKHPPLFHSVAFSQLIGILLYVIAFLGSVAVSLLYNDAILVRYHIKIRNNYWIRAATLLCMVCLMSVPLFVFMEVRFQ